MRADRRYRYVKRDAAYVVMHDGHTLGMVKRSTRWPRHWVASSDETRPYSGPFATRKDAALSLVDWHCDIMPDWLK